MEHMLIGIKDAPPHLFPKMHHNFLRITPKANQIRTHCAAASVFEAVSTQLSF